MEGYFVNDEPRRESQGEWSQTSEYMQRVSIPNLRENQKFDFPNVAMSKFAPQYF